MRTSVKLDLLRGRNWKLCDKDLNKEPEDGLKNLLIDDNSGELLKLLEEKEALEKELAALKEQYDALYSEAARIKADFHNYKRRSESNLKRQKDMIVAELVLNLLPVIDNFERALDCDFDKESNFYRGIYMIYQDLLSVMTSFGVTPIKALDEPFNPAFHEAIAVETVTSADRDGKVVKEVLRGYALNGEIIRPAKVIVGRLNEEEVGNDE